MPLLRILYQLPFECRVHKSMGCIAITCTCRQAHLRGPFVPDGLAFENGCICSHFRSRRVAADFSEKKPTMAELAGVTNLSFALVCFTLGFNLTLGSA